MGQTVGWNEDTELGLLFVQAGQLFYFILEAAGFFEII